ncbi:hypothetical protein Y032_0049g1793 [Ancylostoma ceylanicum]|uniref:Uncharacterized protein n=1 Tax=Ancylostoma ceylanicum TaxID=53326 RepID=A0A016UA48_9BILA|nr:hypothetical protein Y032_0049g1793 [Ancylostoma ceylanicum]
MEHWVHKKTALPTHAYTCGPCRKDRRIGVRFHSVAAAGSRLDLLGLSISLFACLRRSLPEFLGTSA